MADAGKIVITPKGAYSSTKTYEWLDEVSYNGNAYVALKTVTGVTPSDDGVNWRLFMSSTDVDANVLVPKFTEASTRSNIVSGENLSTMFGKIKKWFTDLKSHAFKDLVNNLTTSTTGSALDASQGKILKDEVDGVNRNLDALSYGESAGGINIFNNKFIDGYYIADDIKISAYDGRCISEPIKLVDGNKTYTISKNVDSYIRIAAFNASGEPISFLANESLQKKTFTCPDSTSYIVIGVPNTSSSVLLQDIKIAIGTNETNEPYIMSNAQLTSLNESLNEQGLLNVFDGKLSQGAYNPNTGDRQDYTTRNLVCTDNKILCNPKDTIYIQVENANIDCFHVIEFDFSYKYIKYTKVYVGNMHILSDTARSFLINFHGTTDISPSTIGDINVYINNTIEQLKNDLLTLNKTITETYTTNTDFSKIVGGTVSSAGLTNIEYTIPTEISSAGLGTQSNNSGTLVDALKTSTSKITNFFKTFYDEISQVEEGNTILDFSNNDVTGSLNVFRHKLSENTYLLNVAATITNIAETLSGNGPSVDLTLQDIGFANNIVTANESQCLLASYYPLIVNGNSYCLGGGMASTEADTKGFYLRFLPYKNTKGSINATTNTSFLSGTMVVHTKQLSS